MIRLIPVVVGALLVALVLTVVADAWRSRKTRPTAQRRRPPRPPALAPRQRDYDWERKRDQLARRVKNVPAPGEDRGRILGFIESRDGVEAWVEPRTVMHPLSAVLVAADGEWMRFELRDDAYLRELARERGLKVHDAMRVGYPERMRTYKRPKP